jgi:hypothetical protein
MKTTIDIPEPLCKQAKIRAVETGQTLRQLVIVALTRDLAAPPAAAAAEPRKSFWERRTLLPEYEAALKAGAYSGGTDSTVMIAEDRSSRDDALL